ncbi:MAG: carbohydrate binding domain-containing protein [Candidatus Hodarchaeota archaeon]
MKLNLKTLSKLLTVLTFLIFLSGFNFSTYPQSLKDFSINSIKEWEPTEIPNAYIVTGKHKLSEGSHVWIFLRDRHSNYFLQYPPAEFLDETTWEATNVVIKENVRSLWAVGVDKEGNKTLFDLFKKMKQEDKWDAIQLDYLLSLSGYEKLDQIKIKYDQLPSPIKRSIKSEPDSSTLPKTPDVTSPKSNDQGFLVTDFEKGKNEGEVQQWNHPEDVKVETGYKKLNSPSIKNGNYVAFAKLPLNKKKLKDGWSGGGLVILMNKNESCIDVSKYKYLQFDIYIAQNNNLKNSYIKLEDENGGARAERLISNYGKKLSSKWETIKIPLEDFTKLTSDEKKRWKVLNLKAIKKIVTVSVLDSNHNSTQGTLFIDNIIFTK